MIGRVDVPSGGVGLPQLDQRVGQRFARAVDHADAKADALAGCLGPGHLPEARVGGEAEMEERTDGL